MLIPVISGSFAGKNFILKKLRAYPYGFAWGLSPTLINWRGNNTMQKTSGMNNYNLKIFIVLLFIPWMAVARQDQKKIQSLADSLLIAGRYPGLSIAIQKGDQPPLAIVSGYADTAK